MKGILKRVSIMLCGCLIAILALCLTQKEKSEISTNVRDVEIVEQNVDYQSIINSFDDVIVSQNGTKFSFSGTKAINNGILNEIDNISEYSIEENQIVEYKFAYDYQNNIVEMSVSMNNDIGIIDNETIYGSAFINDKNEIDAVFLVDGEYILLSDLQNSVLDNCGWFKKAIKKAAIVSAAVAVVVTAAVVTTCTCGVGAVIVAGAISGAIAGGASMALSSYEETGEIQAKAVLSGIGVGAAIGAVTGYAVDMLATGMGVSAASSGIADGITYEQVVGIAEQTGDSTTEISKLKEFTSDEVKNYALKADKNASSAETYIGKYYQNSTNSYDEIAKISGKNYFSLDNYDELLKEYGQAEMEKINKYFIIEKLNNGNEIYSTTNPYGEYKGSFAKELEWINNYFGDDYFWEKVGENIWKLIKK